MRKVSKNIIILVIVVIAGIWIVKKKIFPNLREVFSSKPIVVDETPILIKEIKSIAQLITVTSFDEVVVDSTVVTKSSALINSFNRITPVPLIPYVDKRIVLVVKGKVLAGIDLKLLNEQDIQVFADTVNIRLPKAIILDAIINPSDFETFDEKGKWQDAEVRAVKIKARDKMIERALQQDILAKADARSREIIKGFVLSAGYKYVTVETQ